MPEEPIITRTEGSVGWFIVNRPESRNSINYDMWASIPGLIAALNDDPEVRVIIIRGAGDRAFASGADISQFGEERSSIEAVTRYHQAVNAANTAIEESAKPVIAMVNGFAVGGGCEIAVACDLRIAAEHARFGIPSAKLGIVIGYRDVARLTRLVGPAYAREILLTGGLFPAAEALKMGLVNHVVPQAVLEAFTLDKARQIAALAPLAVQGLKRSLLHVTGDPGLREVPQEIRDLSIRYVETEDHREGVTAFMEKRTPVFKGK